MGARAANYASDAPMPHASHGKSHDPALFSASLKSLPNMGVRAVAFGHPSIPPCPAPVFLIFVA